MIRIKTQLISAATFLFTTFLIISCQYNDFSVNNPNGVNGNDSVVLIKAGIKIEIGGILYENLDGHLRITGYDSHNGVQWKNEYDVTGPIDTIEVKNGFHHYS